jgi:hypothetical protein
MKLLEFAGKTEAAQKDSELSTAFKSLKVYNKGSYYSNYTKET